MEIGERRHRMSKKSKVLHHLQTKKRGITGREAWKLYGLYRLSDAIFKLRREGYNIVTSIEEEEDEYGNKVNYARYYLHSKEKA